ncbi:hypothetical protein [Roseovarius sp. A-2]|uniref:hypothetical protein n=1 Tax=Roseovarius sp. A-2 TaxID=1570360 RepID=UPI00111AF4D0|nr:hypothetical protein [Roseovarius sp. A-2]
MTLLTPQFRLNLTKLADHAVGMEQQGKSPAGRQMRVEQRARRARGMAWPVRIGLLGCLGTAIWQEPTLAPDLHDGMKSAVASIEARLEENEQVAAFFKSWTGERLAQDAPNLSASLTDALSN